MDSVLKKLIREGTVSSVYPERCTARVKFEDDDTVSNELPILVRGSQGTKDFWLPEVEEQVVCLFLPTGNARGFILAAFYSESDKPPVQEKNKRHIKFSDGTSFDYDENTHVLNIDVKETITISAPKGVKLIADDPTGTGVQIVGKSSSGSW